MKFILVRLFLFFLVAGSLLAQNNADNKKYDNILKEFSAYRYSKAKIYRVTNSETYKEIFKLFQKDNEKLKKYDPDGSIAIMYNDGKYASVKQALIEKINSNDAPLFQDISMTDDAFKNLKDNFMRAVNSAKDASIQALSSKSDDELLRMFNYFITKFNTTESAYSFFIVTKNKSPQDVTTDDIYGFIKVESAEEERLPEQPTEIITPANYKLYLTKENSLSEDDPNLVNGVVKVLTEQGFNVNTANNTATKDKLEVLGLDANRNVHYLNVFNMIQFDLKQNNLTDVSFEAKGFGGKNRFFAPSFGVTVPMVRGFIPSDPDIQRYRMISEGMATKAKRSFNELIVSPDQIRWTKYKESAGKVFVYNTSKIEEVKSTFLDPKSDSSKVINFMYSLGNTLYVNKAEAETNFKEVFAASGLKLGEGQTIKSLLNAMIKDTTAFGYGSATTNLPEIGFELKTGADEIGYTSFYTGKTSLSVLWKNSQLGLILPTNGLSNVMNDAYGYNNENGKHTNFTYGSFGLYSKFDFTLPILPQTEVFNLEASYLFGDAKFSNFGDKINTADDTYSQAQYSSEFGNYREYITRYTAALHYTFGFAIDEDFQFRVGIGAASYAVETWNNEVQRKGLNETDSVNALKFKKFDSESIGGLSLKLEFLSSSPTTPYGARLQYFDNNLIASTWLQVGVAEDFYLKLTASGFTSSLKNSKRNWELESYFVPNIKLIYYF